MEISKCMRCKNLYSRVKSLVCPKCEIEEEKEIFRVQQFLRDNPGRTMDEVSDALNIYLDDIDRWIEEKRLSVEIQDNSEKKDVVRKLYDTVKEGIDGETALALERLRTSSAGDEGWGGPRGKYRRL